VVDNLPIGYRLTIKGVAPIWKSNRENNWKSRIKDSKEKQNRIKAVTVIDSISYEVKPKETLYSLSKCLTWLKMNLLRLILTLSTELK
jgi:hypothetical protein